MSARQSPEAYGQLDPCRLDHRFLEQRFAFIVGAPRCGTTSLAHYLRAHPDVSFSKVKEPHFFAQHDLRHLGLDELRRLLEQDYLQRFFDYEPRTDQIYAEGSVSYLYAPEQLKPIISLWPQSKFIVCVRDPIEMLPSLHRRLLFIGEESVDNFDTAWTLVEERRKGRHVPRSCVDPRLLDYREAGRLGTYVRRLFDAVGRDRCFVSVYDDLANDPAQHYRRVLNFLGLPDDGRTEFQVYRSGKSYKIAPLQRALKRPPSALQTLAATAKDNSRIETSQAGRYAHAFANMVLKARLRLLRWNRLPAPSTILSAALKRTIRAELRGEIKLLSRLINRNLDHWLEDPMGDVRFKRDLKAPSQRMPAYN